MIVDKGYIFMAYLNPVDELKAAHIQVGMRPVIVVQVSPAYYYCTVVPCTTNVGNRDGVVMDIIPGTTSTVLINQLMTIPITALRHYMGHLNEASMSEIDLGIQMHLGYDYDPDIAKRYFKHINPSLKKSRTLVGKNGTIRFAELTNEDIKFVRTSRADDVAMAYHVSKTTAYNWKKKINEWFLED